MNMAFNRFCHHHGNPIAIGAVFSNLLPWDHVSNMLWSVATAVACWAAVQVISRIINRKKGDQ